MSEKKYYIVWSGLKPGVYETWEECKSQVVGVKGAMYRSFKGITRTRAEEIYADGCPDDYYAPNHSAKENPKPSRDELTSIREQLNIHPDAIAVDASSQGNPGRVEYRGVFVETGEEVFHSRLYPLGTNNLGEFLALVHAMGWQEQRQYFVPIYSDSRTALSWIRQKAYKTTLKRDHHTEEIFRHLDRAVAWLQTHDITRYTLLKWPTEQIGEIPADFGRK